jgi:uncharacterized protein (DUF608 family)
MSDSRWGRRDFLRLSTQAAGVVGLGYGVNSAAAPAVEGAAAKQPSAACDDYSRKFNQPYEGTHLDQIAFPMGGIGAGMICLEGTGALSKVSLHHRPALTSQPMIFAALCVSGPQTKARILEAPVPAWKLRPKAGTLPASVSIWGLPRFGRGTFHPRFPFATVRLTDDEMPLEVVLVGWSPFIPGDADNASLPVASLEYKFVNRSHAPIEAVFSFNSENFMAPSRDLNVDPTSLDRIQATEGGFVLFGPGTEDRPWDKGHFAAWVDESGAQVDHKWFTGGLGVFFDSTRIVWDDISRGRCPMHPPAVDGPSAGASIYVPFALAPGESKAVTVKLAWYVPKSDVFAPSVIIQDGKFVQVTPNAGTYQPWYAGRFAGIDDVARYWQNGYASLRQDTERFSQTLYDSTLPVEVVEAVAANLTILKSPTVLRQTDGRLWGWEGTGDDTGSGGHGSCTHVYNYAQALPHLFPALERTLRETEFGPNQGKDGYQCHRANLPIGPIGDIAEGHHEPSAADGQLGGIIKVYRDWRISGDTAWLRDLWPHVRASLNYCIRTWDPELRGCIEEPHLNTYDVMFWGADSLCTSLYLGALQAAVLIGRSLGDDIDAYSRLLKRGIRLTESNLFNGEYFIQKTEWQNLQTSFPPKEWPADLCPSSADDLELARKEGPPYQYGTGCLADGVLGAWLCLLSGVDDTLDRHKVESHLSSVYRYNLKQSRTDYPQIGRSYLGATDDVGLLVCTWPRGGRPSLPVVYADEMWTGVEYQVASHLIAHGRIEEGLEIVRSARRRYDGRNRNPFAENEAGYWYARAMSSYALLEAFSGARYDAVDQILFLRPSIKGDFRCFLSTATGFGTVGVKDGTPFLEVVSGKIPYTRIHYEPQYHTSMER